MSMPPAWQARQPSKSDAPYFRLRLTTSRCRQPVFHHQDGLCIATRKATPSENHSCCTLQIESIAFWLFPAFVGTLFIDPADILTTLAQIGGRPCSTPR